MYVAVLVVSPLLGMTCEPVYTTGTLGLASSSATSSSSSTALTLAGLYSSFLVSSSSSSGGRRRFAIRDVTTLRGSGGPQRGMEPHQGERRREIQLKHAEAEMTSESSKRHRIVVICHLQVNGRGAYEQDGTLLPLTGLSGAGQTR